MAANPPEPEVSVPPARFLAFLHHPQISCKNHGKRPALKNGGECFFKPFPDVGGIFGTIFDPDIYVDWIIINSIKESRSKE